MRCSAKDNKHYHLCTLLLCRRVHVYSSSSRSRHTRKVDAVLTNTCRTITGCIKLTLLPCLYILAGITPLCRSAIAKVKNRTRRQVTDPSPRPRDSHSQPRKQLFSRSSLLDTIWALLSWMRGTIYALKSGTISMDWLNKKRSLV